MNAAAQAVTIVMVEDDEGHARLIEKNLKRAGVFNEVKHFLNGTAALDFLVGDGRPENRPLLVLLDLNLPDMSGFDILAKLKGDPQLRPVPVIVLTTTDDEREIRRCYELGCSVYITKPVNYETFAQAVRQLGLFLAVIQVPPTP
ncbi:response regulator [Belnapia rosea]|uniref:Response regulator receiver domain-containing protein n=1 Tax=Belnapia rosea TaxID=938405 RepID=A0A1G6LF18_9PROT|nr:response regulator [Belnapia rosea]SDB48816.1 Response regulator receiver domain-containing protein [Belnapia rosea]SDC41804.1 Response regulator receiver domain-containing protein [Belnapia rosea]